MSVDATRWAWKQDVPRAAHKLLLLALADRASADDTSWPSHACLAADTKMNRKTIISGLMDLCRFGLIEDTGERKGETKQISVYRLVGVERRGENSPEKGTVKESQKRNSPKSGTVPFFPLKGPVFSVKESQKRDTEPTMEPTMEPKRETIVSLSNAVACDVNVAPDCPHAEILSLYREILPELQGVIPSRWQGSKSATALRSRWREDKRHQTLDFWRRFFSAVRANSHWMGVNDREWKASIHWLVKRENFDKVLSQMVSGLRRHG